MTLPQSLQPQTLLALAIGAFSGSLAAWLHLPLPWMMGSMIGTTIAALAGIRMRGPHKLRPIVMPVLGVMLGSSITADVLAALPQWGVTIAMLIPFMGIGAGVGYVIYRKMGGYDPVTAYFAAMPGGLAEMLVMGEQYGGNERRIALAHATRILISILVISLFFGLVLGVTTSGGSKNWTGLDALGLRDWIILGLCAAVGAVAGRKLNLPASSVFGPLILSGIAHATGLVAVAPPNVLVILAQIVMGTTIGSRFIGAKLRDIGRDMMIGTLTTVVLLAVSALVAWVVHLMTGVAPAQAFLAYAPGGLSEMSLLALAMDQEVAYVSLTHLARIMMVVAFAGLFFTRLFRPKA